MKRVKTSSTPQASRIRPFRRVGVVTNGVPAAVASLGETYTVSTVVGRSVQVYDAASLRLLFLTQPFTRHAIDCVTAHFQHVFVVAGPSIVVFRRGRVDAEAEIPAAAGVGAGGARARKICVFGEFVCVAAPRAVVVFKWDAKTARLALHASIALPSLLGAVVDACHPQTYLNKLVVATQTSLVLVNVKTGKVVHVYAEHEGGISRIEAAPHVLDVLAVVSPDSGAVALVNLRSGRTLFSLSTGEPVASLSFRSDGVELLALGTANGDVLVYDLGTRKRVQSLRGAAGSASGAGTAAAAAHVAFLQGQAVLVLSSAANELSEYVFDPPLTTHGGHRARLLRRRGGHSAPPARVLFDEDAHFVLSGALDGSLWAFSLRKDSQSRKFGGAGSSGSNGSGGSGGSAVISMAYSPRKQWATLVVAHSGATAARTYNAVTGGAGTVTLPTPDGSLVKQVAVTDCGNFGLVGSSSGALAAYNLQSGLLRMAARAAHAGAITGVAVRPNNAAVFTAALDGTVRETEFQTGKELARVDLGLGAVLAMRFHAPSGLLACATDDMALAVIDTATMRVVRVLQGHGNRITALDFVPSGRWLLSASLDGTLRTWDIPSGACVGGVRLLNPATELRVSSNAEYVATAHVQGLGVQMWVLNAHTGNLRTMREEEFPLEAAVGGASSTAATDGSSSTADDDTAVAVAVEGVEFEEENMHGLAPARASEQIDGRVTLSGEPRVKFTTLVHLDAIRERNRPAEGVKTAEKMPFFLGSADSTGAGANGNGDGGDGGDGSGSRLTQMSAAPVASFSSEFSMLLARGDLEGVVEHLRALGPAATDLEIRSLTPDAELVAFLDAMTAQVRSGALFELVQAWLRMCFDAHRDVFTGEPAAPLRASLAALEAAQRETVGKMNEHVQYCLGVMAFLK